MDLLERFAPLMAQTLHFAGTEEGLALPLEDIQSQLIALADEERALPDQTSAETLEAMSEKRKNDLDLARFAVYAFVDEKMLNAPRMDAAAWTPLSLQCRYFHTSEAGQLYFQKLDDLLFNLGITADFESESLDYAERLEQAKTLSPSASGMDILQVFALCLLYGFRGRLFGQEDLLLRIRKASFMLLHVNAIPLPVAQIPVKKQEPKTFWQFLEPSLYVLVPITVSLAFWFFCAELVANLPITVCK